MGSIQKRGTNSWRLIVELGYDAKGKRVQKKKTIRVDDPALLRAPKRLENYLDTELRKFQLEVEAGTYVRLEKMTFEAFVEQWISKFVDVDLEVKTRDNYLYHTKRRILPYFGHMHLDQIKTMHINDYMEYLRSPAARNDGKKDKPLGSATLVYNYRVLRSIFTKAVDWRVLKDNPMAGVSKPKEDDVKEMEVYDEREIAALFQALEDEPTHLRVLIMLAVTTGLRRGELAGLEWKHIDLERGILEVKTTIPKLSNGEPVIKGPKNKKSARKIALSPSVIKELETFRSEWRKERLQIEDKWEGGQHEFLFSALNGKPHDPQRLTKRWIEFHRKHGLKPIRLHDLRHTSVSWLIFKKVHSEAIAKRVGHSNTKMMEIYGHIFESVDREAASTFEDIVIPFRKKA
ncbi:site-specific integrase [Paenibacillus validus]|uniref:site-specific integrase n=1 Tax=Paenibacillus validus TaxID=44253 RepID=UPI000FDABFB8|nr:site-specific integrase [Paenibacillus validus]MED4602550.1 site-specific integrase [Paenibacillus validus]MED4606075.1 site-specific integrase [Paenibacillus validus]